MSDYWVILGGTTHDDARVRYPIARKYGFLNAGGGKRHWWPLRRLCRGDRVFAYVGGKGYVGIAEVTGKVMFARDATVIGGGPLVEQSDIDADFKERARRYDDTTEKVVPVKWIKGPVDDVADAVPVTRDLFWGRHTVCLLKPDNDKHQRTIETVVRQLGPSPRP